MPCTGEIEAVDRHSPPSLEALETEVVGQSRRPAIRPGGGRPGGKKKKNKKGNRKGEKQGKNTKGKGKCYVEI